MIKKVLLSIAILLVPTSSFSWTIGTKQYEGLDYIVNSSPAGKIQQIQCPSCSYDINTKELIISGSGGGTSGGLVTGGPDLVTACLPAGDEACENTAVRFSSVTVPCDPSTGACFLELTPNTLSINITNLPSNKCRLAFLSDRVETICTGKPKRTLAFTSELGGMSGCPPNQGVVGQTCVDVATQGELNDKVVLIGNTMYVWTCADPSLKACQLSPVTFANVVVPCSSAAGSCMWQISPNDITIDTSLSTDKCMLGFNGNKKLVSFCPGPGQAIIEYGLSSSGGSTISCPIGQAQVGASGGMSCLDISTQLELNNHMAQASAHHTRYTDSEAIEAVETNPIDLASGATINNNPICFDSGSGCGAGGGSLSSITNPTGDKTFSMGTNQLIFSYTTPNDAQGAFKIYSNGAWTGALFSVVQDTGNPVSGNHLMLLEADDQSINYLITRAHHDSTDTYPVINEWHSATPAVTDGIHPVRVKMWNSSSVLETVGDIAWRWTDLTVGSEDAEIIFYTIQNSSASPVEVMNISSLGTVTVPGQFISTLADGTAPLVVTSTTKVNNLNVDRLDNISLGTMGTTGQFCTINTTPDPDVIDCNTTGGGGGDSITVNGVAVSDADFDSSTPAAETNYVNVKFQKDASSPANISAEVAAATASVLGVAFFPATDFGITAGGSVSIISGMTRDSELADETGLLTLNTTAGVDNFFTDAEVAGGFDVDNSQTECLTLLGAAINCFGTGGCVAPALKNGTNFSYRVPYFGASTDSAGSWIFRTPYNLTGTTGIIRVGWTGYVGCANGTTDDVAWVIDGDSIADSANFDGASLDGTDVCMTDRCASGGYVHEISTTFTHSMTHDETAIIKIFRDVDGGTTGCAGTGDDDYDQDAALLWVEFCYEVNNIFSGEN